MKKLWLLGLIFVIPFAQAAGGGQRDSSGGKIEMRISWWGSDARHNATIDALEAYMRRHPNINISPEYQGFDEIGRAHV